MSTVYFNEGFAPVQNYDQVNGLLRRIAAEIQLAASPNWAVHFPATSAEITNHLVLKYQLKDEAGVQSKDVFIELHQPPSVERLTTNGQAVENVPNRPNYYYMDVVFGTGIYAAPTQVDANGFFINSGVFEEDKASVRARWAWFRNETDSVVKKWLPIQFWVSITDEALQVVLAGDLSANKLDRIMSYGYFGKLKPFKNSKERWDANFGVTVGSDTPPGDYLTLEEKERYSDKTGTSVNDITMLATYTGFPLQAHMIAFATPDEFIDKKIEGPSNYTGKYHMSPVYVYHGFDGYRGELQGVVATDRSTVVNKDDLIHKYNKTTGQEVNPDTQDIYKVFLVNAPYSFFTNSTNVLYGLAILKETGPYTP